MLYKNNLVWATTSIDKENEDPNSTESENLQTIQENTSVDEWSEEETRYLINFYAEHEEEFKHVKKKKQLWQILAESMLAEFGKCRNSDKCQRKWINLCSVYRKIKDNKRQTGRGCITYKYFDALDEILGHRPSNAESTYIVDVGTCSNQGKIDSNQAQEILPHTSDTPENVSEESSSETSAQSGPSTSGNKRNVRRKRKNFTQELYKTKINYLRLKTEERSEKRKRHEERMDLERKRMEIEEKKNKDSARNFRQSELEKNFCPRNVFVNVNFNQRIFYYLEIKFVSISIH